MHAAVVFVRGSDLHKFLFLCCFLYLPYHCVEPCKKNKVFICQILFEHGDQLHSQFDESFTSRMAQHLVHVVWVLEFPFRVHLCFQPGKTVILAVGLGFLGLFLWSRARNGLSPAQVNVAAVCKLWAPHKLRQMQSSLEFLNYYRREIPNQDQCDGLAQRLLGAWSLKLKISSHELKARTNAQHQSHGTAAKQIKNVE